jgi:hypothetical protein
VQQPFPLEYLHFVSKDPVNSPQELALPRKDRIRPNDDSLARGTAGIPFAPTTLEMSLGPINEKLDVRRIGVTAITLLPGKRTIQESVIDGGHGSYSVILRYPKTIATEQTENPIGGNGCHKTASLIKPLGVRLFGNPITNERQPRCTERD